MKTKMVSLDPDRLVRVALDSERKRALDREAADFFSVAPSDREKRRFLQQATSISLAHE
jgi:hypothetical protein